MKESLIKAIEKNNGRIELGGPASQDAIDVTSRALGVELPESLMDFARNFGWLEVDNTYVFGVPKNPLTDEGSCVRMTLYARQTWNLPTELIVIYSSEDEVLWCVTGGKGTAAASAKVIAFSTHQGKTTGIVGNDLLDVIEELISE
ncbi:MAG: SMI1/KNR4 family protein [Fimbriimonadaceae bacterium]|jgi:hypothetical protein